MNIKFDLINIKLNNKYNGVIIWKFITLGASTRSKKERYIKRRIFRKVKQIFKDLEEVSNIYSFFYLINYNFK